MPSLSREVSAARVPARSDKPADSRWISHFQEILQILFEGPITYGTRPPLGVRGWVCGAGMGQREWCE